MKPDSSLGPHFCRLVLGAAFHPQGCPTTLVSHPVSVHSPVRNAPLSDQVPNRRDGHGPTRAQKTRHGQPRGPLHSQGGSGPPSRLPGRDVVAGGGSPAPPPIPWWNSSTEEDPHSRASHQKQNVSHAPEWNVQGKLPSVYFIQPSLAKT